MEQLKIFEINHNKSFEENKYDCNLHVRNTDINLTEGHIIRMPERQLHRALDQLTHYFFDNFIYAAILNENSKKGLQM